MNDSKFMTKLKLTKETSDYVIGYTEHELKKIEALYNIIIQGQLKELLLLAGRCSGGLVGDDPIILYRELWDVRTQIMFQNTLIEDLYELKTESLQWKDYMGDYGQIFCFSWEWETQYYYLITEHDDDLVYHYDENMETAECTGLTLFQYLDRVYEEESKRKHIICRGELLEIYV